MVSEIRCSEFVPFGHTSDSAASIFIQDQLGGFSNWYHILFVLCLYVHIGVSRRQLV